MALGFERKPSSELEIGEEGGGGTFIPLLANVESLKIRYFDPRLNTWVDKWTDTVTLPRLVSLSIGRSGDSVPWEAIVALGRTPL